MQSLVLELILQPLHWLDCLVRLVHQNNSSVHLHLYSKSRYRNLGYSRRWQNITIASCRILLSTRPRKSLLSRNISCQRCFHMGSKEPSSTAKSEPVSYLSKNSHWVLLRVRLQLHTHTHTHAHTCFKCHWHWQCARPLLFDRLQSEDLATAYHKRVPEVYKPPQDLLDSLTEPTKAPRRDCSATLVTRLAKSQLQGKKQVGTQRPARRM